MKHLLLPLTTSLAVFFLMLGTASGQDDITEQIYGTWLLDIDATAELIDDEQSVERMRTMMETTPLRMIFNEDKSMDMLQGDQGFPSPLTFELSAQDDSKTIFNITISGPPSPLEGEVEFLESGALRVQPSGQESVVLNREVEVVPLDKAAEFFAGMWKVNQKESKKVAAEAGEEPTSDLPNLTINFTDDGVALSEDDKNEIESPITIKAGEEENNFVVTLTGENAGGMAIKVKVLGKDRVQIVPGENSIAVFDRVKK